MGEFLKGYKGFEKGLVCRKKQYKENTVFEEKNAVVCRKGMHFCVNPFEVLNHYDLVNCDGSFNDFVEVEALEESQTDDGKKYCTTKLKVGTKLSFAGFIKACVDFVIEKTSVEVEISEVETNKENETLISSKDKNAKNGSSGYSAQIDSSGEYSVICCAGHGSKVKAKKGSWITLAEWEKSEEKDRWIPKCVKTEYVDGERIKEDTFYKIKNGEFKEV